MGTTKLQSYCSNILLVFLDLPYLPADQVCAFASCKVRQHKAEPPGTFFPVNFLGERGLVFLLPALFACCSSGQDAWCGRHVPLSTLRLPLTSSPWAQTSPLIFLMPVTLPLLLLMFPGMLQMQECFMKLGGAESLTEACIHHRSLQPQHTKTRVKGWSSASSGSALPALLCASFTSLMLLNIWLPPSCHPATAHPLTDVNGYYIYPEESWKLPWQWLWLLGNARS